MSIYSDLICLLSLLVLTLAIQVLRVAFLCFTLALGGPLTAHLVRPRFSCFPAHSVISVPADRFFFVCLFSFGFTIPLSFG